MSHEQMGLGTPPAVIDLAVAALLAFDRVGDSPTAPPHDLPLGGRAISGTGVPFVARCHV